MFDLWLSRPVFFLGSFRRMWAFSKDRSHPQQHCKPEENILQANKYLASSKQTSKQLRGRLGLPVYKFLVCSSNFNKHQPCLLSAYIFILQMIIRGNELQANGGQIVWKCLSFYRLLSLVGSQWNLFGEYLDLPPRLRTLTILVTNIWDKGIAKGITTCAKSVSSLAPAIMGSPIWIRVKTMSGQRSSPEFAQNSPHILTKIFTIVSRVSGASSWSTAAWNGVVLEMIKILNFWVAYFSSCLDAYLAVVTSHVNILRCLTDAGTHPVSLVSEAGGRLHLVSP